MYKLGKIGKWVTKHEYEYTFESNKTPTTNIRLQIANIITPTNSYKYTYNNNQYTIKTEYPLTDTITKQLQNFL